MRLAPAAPEGLVNRLTQRLKEWTGRAWFVTLSADDAGAATLRDAREQEVRAHPIVEMAMTLFPGAEITAIREPELTPAAAADRDDDVEDDVEAGRETDREADSQLTDQGNR